VTAVLKTTLVGIAPAVVERIAAVDYDALDVALARASRFTLANASDEELRTSHSYARDVIRHALHGNHRAYFPAILDIARHGRGAFQYNPEFKHLTYTALAEGLLQLCALTPRTDRPDVQQRGERSSGTETRLCATVAGLYLVAADAIRERITLRSVTDGPITERRESLDACLAAADSGTHVRFTRLLTQEIVELAQDYLVAQAAAQEEADIVNSPFRLIARDPRAHVQYLRMTVANVTGRSVQEFAF